MKPLFLFLSIVFVCGCSAKKSLAHRLEGADRVIVTNTFEHLSITVTGEEVDKINRAIAASKKVSPHISATPGLGLEFFKGDEYLGTVDTSYQVFWIEDKPCKDTTVVLEGLYQKFREEQRPQFSP